jgi:multimeric flavodoxin WrbA
MCKLLILLDADDLVRLPAMIREVANGARTAGAEVRLRTLTDARLRDIEWADRLALGIRIRGGGVPPAVKRWVDGLGFCGWRVFRGKPGWVIPIAGHDVATSAAPPACHAAAHLLATRGMSPVIAGHSGIAEPEPRNDEDKPRYRPCAALARAHMPIAPEKARVGGRRQQTPPG